MTRNKRITRWFSIVLVLVLSLMLMGSTMMDGEHHHELRAKLSGAAEVPGPGDPDGKGKAKITVMMVGMEEHQVCWDIKVKDITLPAAAAHIHIGPEGAAGPIVVGLTPPGANGSSSGCKAIAHELAMNLHMHPEQYYVNVHTSDFPAGALRGQLFLAEE
jgi:hypothetical protein